MPHQLLEFAIKSTASRNELCVFLFFIRYTLGFRRGHCQAGYGFLTEWTGIGDVSNLKKALKTLLAVGLIKKLKEHNSAANTGAIYEVPVVRAFLDFSGGGPQRSARETTQETQPTGGTTPRATHPSPSGQSTYSPLGKSPTKKENNKQNLNKRSTRNLIEAPKNQLQNLYMDAMMETEPTEDEKQRAILEFERELSEDARSQLISDFKIGKCPVGIYPPNRVLKTLVALEWSRTKLQEKGLGSSEPAQMPDCAA